MNLARGLVLTLDIKALIQQQWTLRGTRAYRGAFDSSYLHISYAGLLVHAFHLNGEHGIVVRTSRVLDACFHNCDHDKQIHIEYKAPYVRSICESMNR
jgi:hypothetical protein